MSEFGSLSLLFVCYLIARNSNSFIIWQQQKLLAWQLANPLGTVEECIDWMRQADSKRLKTEQ